MKMKIKTWKLFFVLFRKVHDSLNLSCLSRFAIKAPANNDVNVSCDENPKISSQNFYYPSL
jgi:hypothetical protein